MCRDTWEKFLGGFVSGSFKACFMLVLKQDGLADFFIRCVRVKFIV